MKSGMLVRSALLLALSSALPGLANADTYTFNFTGRMTIGLNGDAITGGTPEFDNYQTPISASLTYDTVTGLGSSSLSITLDQPFFGASATFHDIAITRVGETNLFNGSLQADWGSNLNILIAIQWDGTGFLNAVNSGVLTVGDKISGDVLYHDSNGDQVYSADEVVIASLGSATPYADALVASTMANYGDTPVNYTPQNHAPLAATSASLGVTSGALQGVKVYLDIGSGNSLYVTAITAVPEPETYAMMLSGLGLVGWSARRRKQRQ
ncbi:MAG: PEP-CTERM sorting domain-containing protein [Thiobacillus sp.]